MESQEILTFNILLNIYVLFFFLYTVWIEALESPRLQPQPVQVDLGSMLSRQFLNNMITKLYNLFASVFNYFLMQKCMLV